MIADPRLRIAAMAVVIVLAVGAAYGIWASSTSSGSLTLGSAAPAAPAAPGATSSSLPSSLPGGSGAPGTSGGSGSRAVVDRGLLAVLPASVGGNALAEDADAERQAIADPDLGGNVDRLVTAFVGDSGGANWAYTAVVDVRPSAQTDDFYADWRDSFDASACGVAGGVTGHATVQIAGRAVDRATCAGGVRTYHVRISGSGLLVSISDLGDARFGEQVIVGLRP